MFKGEDDSDLYLEEREASLKTAQEEKRKVQLSVPGILNPHEIPEEMQDWGIKNLKHPRGSLHPTCFYLDFVLT